MQDMFYYKVIIRQKETKMETTKTNLNKVWISFAIYLIGYFAIMIIFKDQSLAWLELEAFSLIVSIAMLKNIIFREGKALSYQ